MIGPVNGEKLSTTFRNCLSRRLSPTRYISRGRGYVFFSVLHPVGIRLSLGATMKIVYDTRRVPAHNAKIPASVYLMNEAPGPDEALAGIPSFGQQGANIFHSLRMAGISWATWFPKIVWPKNGSPEKSARHQEKEDFLLARARHITCTNAFPHWPKPHVDSKTFCPPLEADVLSSENIERIKCELQSTSKAILICGTFAYMACTGIKLSSPSTREGTELSHDEISTINHRLSAKFEKGWYMGHTRRWSISKVKTLTALKELAHFSKWALDA